MTTPGKLYLVGTPIGNLGDISERALATLRQVDRIAAEDTRRTRQLLSHFGITGKRLDTLNAHSSSRDLDALLDRVAEGAEVALVTDAGMPSVSDPGTALVARAAARAVEVVPIPGPSALTAAVAVSGLVAGPFTFLGFLPQKGQKRRALLARIRDASEPVVLFEAPHRAARTLADLAELLPERRAVLCRELTKLHEQVLRASLSELGRIESEFRGEITLVIEAAPEPPAEAVDLSDQIEQRFSEGASVKTIVGELAERANVPRRELYDLVQSLKEARAGTTSAVSGKSDHERHE